MLQLCALEVLSWKTFQNMVSYIRRDLLLYVHTCICETLAVVGAVGTHSYPQPSSSRRVPPLLLLLFTRYRTKYPVQVRVL